MTRPEVTTSPNRTCPQCDGEVLVSARVPHGWNNANGHEVQGSREVVLCAKCDTDNPAASAIITFFTVHATVTDETLEQFAELLRRWVAQIEAPRLDTTSLEADVEAWRRGEL